MVFYAIFLVGSGGTLLEKDAVLAFSAVPVSIIGTSESESVCFSIDTFQVKRGKSRPSVSRPRL